MDVLGSAGPVLQNQALTQNRLANDVNALASGLRVRSASDDPSGYAIAQTIQTKVLGLQQSVTSVQTANNLLNVADGALNSIELILQRIRSLVVESNSGINSQNDLQNLQTEIGQLLLEINKISSETNFNGLTLFNGQFQTQNQSTPLINGLPSGILTTENNPFPNAATGADGTNAVPNGTPNNAFMTPQQVTVGSFIPTFTVWSIVSASTNMIDPDSQTAIGPGVLIQEEAFSLASGFGPSPIFVDYSALPFTGTGGVAVPLNTPSGNLIFDSVFGNITNLADAVGAQATFLTELPPTPVTGGHALTVNDGGDEGQTVSISIPELNTNVLNISDITVLDLAVTTVDPASGGNPATPAVSGISSSNILNASYAEIQVDAALETIGGIRAQVGAQTVALQNDAQNDSVTIVNETAAVSNIRDADIGAVSTDFAKQQILASVGNSVLAQINVSAQQLTALLLNSFSGAPI
jgi:flagellin